MTRTITFSLIALIAASSCNNSQRQEDAPKRELPPAAASVEATKKSISHTSYVVEDVALVRMFMEREDTTLWSKELTDTTKMFKDFMSSAKALTLDFLTDSTAGVRTSKQTFPASWSVVKDTGMIQSLLLTYADPELSFNDGNPEPVTFTYKIKGISDNELFLEAPREYNRQKLLLLMKKK